MSTYPSLFPIYYPPGFPFPILYPCYPTLVSNFDSSSKIYRYSESVNQSNPVNWLWNYLQEKQKNLVSHKPIIEVPIFNQSRPGVINFSDIEKNGYILNPQSNRFESKVKKSKHINKKFSRKRESQNNNKKRLLDDSKMVKKPKYKSKKENFTPRVEHNFFPQPQVCENWKILLSPNSSLEKINNSSEENDLQRERDLTMQSHSQNFNKSGSQYREDQKFYDSRNKNPNHFGAKWDRNDPDTSEFSYNGSKYYEKKYNNFPKYRKTSKRYKPFPNFRLNEENALSEFGTNSELDTEVPKQQVTYTILRKPAPSLTKNVFPLSNSDQPSTNNCVDTMQNSLHSFAQKSIPLNINNIEQLNNLSEFGTKSMSILEQNGTLAQNESDFGTKSKLLDSDFGGSSLFYKDSEENATSISEQDEIPGENGLEEVKIGEKSRLEKDQFKVKKQYVTGKDQFKKTMEVNMNQVYQVDWSVVKPGRAGLVVCSQRQINNKKEIRLCFGLDAQHGEITDFGGGVCPSYDTSSLTGALREFQEETHRVFGPVTQYEMQANWVIYNSNMLIGFLIRDVDEEAISKAFIGKVRYSSEISCLVWISLEELEILINGGTIKSPDGFRNWKLYERVRKLFSSIGPNLLSYLNYLENS